MKNFKHDYWNDPYLNVQLSTTETKFTGELMHSTL